MFSRPAGYTRKHRVRLVRGPHFYVESLGSAENFRITERLQAEFRMDAKQHLQPPVMA